MSRIALLSRPQPVRDGVAQSLSDTGMAYIDAPTLRVTAHIDPDFEAHLPTQDYDGMVFVSQHAVFFAAERMAALNFAPAPDIWLAAVGMATGQAIKETWPNRLITPQVDDAQDTDGLWRALQQAQVLSPAKRVLIIRAQTGRDALRERLQNANIEVDIWSCYRRDILPWTAKQQAQVNHALQQHGLVIALTSIEGLHGLMQHLTSNVLQQPVVTIHPAIADAARQYGFERVVCVPPHQMSTALLAQRD